MSRRKGPLSRKYIAPCDLAMIVHENCANAHWRPSLTASRRPRTALSRPSGSILWLRERRLARSGEHFPSRPWNLIYSARKMVLTRRHAQCYVFRWFSHAP
jgi:hypothetical protein